MNRSKIENSQRAKTVPHERRDRIEAAWAACQAACQAALRKHQAELRERQARIEAAWATRHPERARAERQLRQAQRKAARDYGHKVHGTTETHAKAARQQQGAIARLYAGGHLTIDQLGAAAELLAAAEAIGAGVAVRTVSLETRVDTSRNPGRQFHEALGAVRREVTFGRWRNLVRERLGPVALALTLAVVVEDLALRPAAQRARMRDARARGLLGRALDLWTAIHRTVVREIDPASLAAAQAGLI